MNAILQASVLYHGHKKWAQEHIFATQSHYHRSLSQLSLHPAKQLYYHNSLLQSSLHTAKQSHYHSSVLQSTTSWQTITLSQLIITALHLSMQSPWQKKKNSLFVITAHYYILPTAITLSKLTTASSTTLHAITLSHLQRLTNTTNYSQPSPFEQLVQHTTKWEPVRAGVIGCALLQDFRCHVTMCPAVGTDQTENLWDLLIQLYISQKIADTLKRCT